MNTCRSRILRTTKILVVICLICTADHSLAVDEYDATIDGKEILTPRAAAVPRITGAAVFGVRPGKPLSFRVSATGERPLSLHASGLPRGAKIDRETGWISGRAPEKKGDVTVTLTVKNAKGADNRELTLRIGDTICLTPPMGWNSWYVLAMSVSDENIRAVADAMLKKGLADYGWTYVNIDDCWSGKRDKNGAMHPCSKFSDMKDLVKYVNGRGFKLGIYSTPWMATYCGHLGGSAPNEQYDYTGCPPEKYRPCCARTICAFLDSIARSPLC